MMESNFYSDEFEQLIREKTEQYKMYPSEKVWKGVHGSLHTKRRWFIAGMFALITGTLFLAGKELISPANHNAGNKKIASVAGGNNTTETREGTRKPRNASASTFSGFRPTISTSIGSRRGSQDQGPSGDDNHLFRGITITISDPVISQPDLSEYLSKAIRLPDEAPALPGIASGMASRPEEGLSTKAGSGITAGGGIAVSTGVTGSATGSDPGDSRNVEALSAGEKGAAEEKGKKSAHSAKNSLSLSRTASEPEISGDLLSDPAGDAVKNSLVNKLSEAMDQQRINWLQEYALNYLSSPPKRGRKYWQVYVSPKVNYRAVSGVNLGKFVPSNSTSYAIGAGDWLDHEPALGFEAGGSFLYRVTRNLTLKAGVQFNLSRYNFKAYIDSTRTNSPLFSAYGAYLDASNKKGIMPGNDNYQLSAPIGFELRVLGNERLQFHIAASAQPTYQLNLNSYILTTDFRGYEKNPFQFRRWNLNGSLEAFLSYRIGKIRWQVGPEFRYQFLSTYNSQYPIQENLKGYGIKIGITKAIQ